jgi:Transglycosylase SLT domain
MANFLKDPSYLDYLAELETINGIPTGILPKMMRIESGGDPTARSPKGARGLFQFMGPTAREVGINPDDPIEAAGGAAIYLRRLYNQFGNWEKATAAYNAGPGNISKGIYPKETRDYNAKLWGPEPPAPAPPVPGTERGKATRAVPEKASTPGELAPRSEPGAGPTLPPYLQDLAEGLVKYVGVLPESLNLEDIKRLPGVAATHLMKGLGEAADFFLGGPIITTQQTAPAFGLTPLPEIPKDFVTESLAAQGLISPTYEPKGPRERRVAGVSELVGMGAVDPTVARGGVKAIETVGRHLVEEVGRGKALGAGQRGAIGPLGRVPLPSGAPPPAAPQELALTMAERVRVQADIRRFSKLKRDLTQSEKERLGGLHNELTALDVTLRTLRGGLTKPALTQIAALNSAQNVREIARRGRQTWAETERLSRALREERLPELARLTGASVKDVDSVMRRQIGEAYNAEHIDNAAHQLKTQWAADQAFYRDMAAKMQAGTFADADILAAHERILNTTALNEQYSGIRAEAGRALNIFNKMKREGIYDINERVSAALAQHHGNEADLLKAKIIALSRLEATNPAQGIQETRKLFEATGWDKFHEGLYAFVLSGIPTQIANAAGNWGVQLFEDIVRFSAAAKPWRRDVTMREAMAHFNGWFGGTLDGLKAFAHVMKTEAAYGPFVTEVTRGRAIKGLKGRLIRTPLTAMQATDAFFKAMSYAKTKRALATRESLKTGRPFNQFMDESTPEGKEIKKQATAEAHRRTFTDPPGKYVRAIESVRATHPLMRIPMLFVRTPAKLLGMPLKNNILTGGFFRDVRETLAKGGAEAQLQKERMMLGTALGGIAYFMADQELITGAAPDEPALRDLFYQSGRQPYAINLKALGLGEGWLPYKRFEPWATYLGAVADMNTFMKERPLNEDEERTVMDYFVTLMGGITQNFSDKTFMRSITDFTEAWSDPERFLENYAANLAGLAIPTIVAHKAKADDPFMREANGFFDRLRLKLPLDIGFGKRQDLPRKVSGFGEFVTERGTWLQRMTSPFIPSGFRHDPLVEELLRLGVGVGVQPRHKEKTIPQVGPGGELRLEPVKVNLDPATYELLATTRGELMRAYMASVIASPGYQAAPEYEKKYIVETILSRAKRKIGAALDRGFEGKLLELALTQHPIDIMELKTPGRPPSPP